jgi:hypothetical protein
MSYLHDVAGDYKAWLQEQAEQDDELAMREGYAEWQAGAALKQLGPHAQRRVLQEVFGAQLRRLRDQQRDWERQREQCYDMGRVDASSYWTGKVHGMAAALDELVGGES